MTLVLSPSAALVMEKIIAQMVNREAVYTIPLSDESSTVTVTFTYTKDKATISLLHDDVTKLLDATTKIKDSGKNEHLR
jgi:hypothetical protein